MALKRFGISIEEDLAADFDRLIEERGYENRSEAIRDMMRSALAERKLADPDMPSIGAVAIVFDHGRHLNHRLVHEEHRHIEEIISTMHVHMSEERCLEIIVIRGKASRVKEIADSFIGIRGVLYGELILQTPK